MQKANISQKIILTYTFFIALCSVLILTGMLRSPSEPGSALVLGLSASRLVIALGFAVIFLAFAGLFVKALHQPQWADRFIEEWFGSGRLSRVIAWLAGISLGLGWVGVFLPAYRAGVLGPHWNRIQPVMFFILLASLATLAVFAAQRSDFSIRWLGTSPVIRLGFVLFLASLPFLAITIYSKYDAYILEDFWYGSGVPILTSQMMVAIFAGMLLLLAGQNFTSQRADWFIIILLYGITAVVWALQPLERSFLFPGPYAPNGVLYPFGDAATFDMASQFGLIGQGIYIFNTPFFERTFYLSFLIYLHTLFGQDYPLLMTVQAVIFAVLPVLVYLIGRSLNMRAAGFMAALITMFRGANSIAATNMIDSAGPKVIMTDFPTAIAIALLILLICEWFRKPEQRWRYALWVGGAIGLVIMLRTNGLIFLLFVPLYAFFRLMPRWRSWLLASTLMIFAVIAITLPWELRNVSRGAMLYQPILTKIQHVLRTRYPSSSGNLPQDQILSLVTLQQTQPLTSLYGKAQQGQACQTIACFAPRHFIHNVITSILTLPPTAMLDDLRHTVKESYPYWRPDWDGKFTPGALSLFLWNLFCITLGISASWKQQRLAGLTPLAIYVFYQLSNAFARTSGGRYIVPVDWILSLYFAAGLLFLVRALAEAAHYRLGTRIDLEVNEHEKPFSSRSPLRMAILILLILFAIGALVPLAEKLHPPRYAHVNVQQVLQEQEEVLAAAGVTMEQINTLLKSPGSQVLVGRSLYPRSYKMEQGEFGFYPYVIMDFPRTAFVLIGPDGSDGIVLPGGYPEHLPHTADALVIGCQTQEYTDALAVVLLDGSQAVYTRDPMPELTCPLKQPVCNNNSVCE